MRTDRFSRMTSLFLLIFSVITLTSCSTQETTTKVERQVVAYDQSEPLPQDSGLKVRLETPVEGLLFQPGKEPAQVQVNPGTYVLQGVNVYRRMAAKVAALQKYIAGLPPEAQMALATSLSGLENAILSGK